MRAASSCVHAAAGTARTLPSSRRRASIMDFRRSGRLGDMDKRALGQQGLTVSAQGLGCMGMSAFYGAFDDTESTATLQRALELGVTFWDTADAYGPFTNERL